MGSICNSGCTTCANKLHRDSDGPTCGEIVAKSVWRAEVARAELPPKPGQSAAEQNAVTKYLIQGAGLPDLTDRADAGLTQDSLERGTHDARERMINRLKNGEPDSGTADAETARVDGRAMIDLAVNRAFTKLDEKGKHSAGTTPTVYGNDGDARARMIERMKADSRGPVGTTAEDFPDDGGNFREHVDAGAPTPDTDARDARARMIAGMHAESRGH